MTPDEADSGKVGLQKLDAAFSEGTPKLSFLTIRCQKSPDITAGAYAAN
jgi:hypothetical protein